MRLWSLALRQWRRSLGLRVVAITLVLGGLGVGSVAWFIADQISARLFEAKEQQIKRDAALTSEDFRQVLAGMDVTTRAEINQFLRNAVGRQQQSGDGLDRGVLLLRNGNNDSEVQVFEVIDGPQSVITPELQDALKESTGQYYQSVALTLDGRQVPGVVVGQQIAVPFAGPHDLFLVYDLETEQNTLTAVQRALVFGGLGLLALLGVVAWVVARLVVAPLRQAAGAANQLSAGDLSKRLPVHSDDELGSLARSFNDMAQNLQDKIEAMAELSLLQRRFVSDVSHELRTPLTTIRMAADVIRAADDQLDPVTARSSELLGTQLDRFEQLLADLLEISRFDAGAALLDADDLDVALLVEGVLDMMRPLADAHDVQLRCEVSSPPVRAVCDKLRVERIVRNLVANAVEHCEGHPIDIAVAANDTTAAVTVRDYGVGLSDADIRRVFDRFWRADPARARTTGGTGLGLSISMEDARLHGGILEVWGSPGDGAAFRLTIPVRPGEEFTTSALPLPDRQYAIRDITADDPEPATS